jgi:membrane protease YdiL (CAAX protease family)
VIAVRLIVPSIVTLALGYVVMAMQVQLWTWFTPAFDAWRVGSMPFYLLWLGVGLVASAALRIGRVPWRSRHRAPIALAIVVGLSALMYLSAFVRLAGGEGHWPNGVFHLLAGGIVGPIVEEWLFRGLLWSRLERATHRVWITIAVSSLVFGFFHMSFEGHTWLAFGNAFVHAGFGALMGVLRWRLGGIAVGCAIHAGGNCLAVLAF